ncbi:MAG: putative sensor protein [Bryobacterales bacterium]|nr:putative sensor protein [Bryobacterales bacterium]
MTQLVGPDLPVSVDAQLIDILVAELGDVLAFRTDAAGFTTDWNPGVERILGYGRAEWVGQRVHLIFTPEDRAAKKPERDMAKAAREGRAPTAGPYLRETEASCL